MILQLCHNPKSDRDDAYHNLQAGKPKSKIKFVEDNNLIIIMIIRNKRKEE